MSSRRVNAKPTVKAKIVRVIVCPRCGYEWVPVVFKPQKCPECQKGLDWSDVDDQIKKWMRLYEMDPSLILYDNMLDDLN